MKKSAEEVLALVAKLEAARGEDLKVLAVYHLPELLEIARASVARSPQWVKGTGSDLPNGTQAWVAYRTKHVVAVSLERRCDGGWGESDDDRCAFPDESDPDLFLREDLSFLFDGPSIVAYRLQTTPEPPKE